MRVKSREGKKKKEKKKKEEKKKKKRITLTMHFKLITLQKKLILSTSPFKCGANIAQEIPMGIQIINDNSNVPRRPIRSIIKIGKRKAGISAIAPQKTFVATSLLCSRPPPSFNVKGKTQIKP